MVQKHPLSLISTDFVLTRNDKSSGFGASPEAKSILGLASG